MNFFERKKLKKSEFLSSFQIKAVFYTGIVPTILIFMANTAGNYSFFFVPYLAAVTGQIAVILRSYLSICFNKKHKNGIEVLHVSAISLITLCTVSLYPVLSYNLSNKGVALLLLAGSVLTAQLFHSLVKRTWNQRSAEDKKFEYQSRMIAVGVSACIVLVIQILI